MEIYFVLPPEHVSTQLRNKIKQSYRNQGLEVDCIYHSQELFFREPLNQSSPDAVYCITFKRHYFIQLINWMEKSRENGFKGKILLSIEGESFDYEVIPKFIACGGNEIISFKEWVANPSLLTDGDHCMEVESWLHNHNQNRRMDIYNENALAFLYQQLIEEDQVSLDAIAYVYEALDKQHKENFLTCIKDFRKSANWLNTQKKSIDFAGEGLICVWDNPQFATELSVMTAQEANKKTLLIDLDRLNPRIDFCCPMTASGNNIEEKDLYGIQRIHTNKISVDGYEKLCMSQKNVRNLKVLYGLSELKQFEYFTNEALLDALAYYKKRFEVVIINVNDFIYDAYTCLGILTSNLVLFPIDGSLSQLRHCQRSINLLEEKQRLEIDKCHYLLYDYDPRVIHEMSLLADIIDGGFIGKIEACKKRNSLRNLRKNYAKHMSKRILKDYKRLLKTMNMEVL